MNLTGQTVAPKPERAERDPDHMARVAELPCCICEAWGMEQRSPTQVHHVCHDRYSQRRVSDRMTIPLCEGHHQGLREKGKTAIHRSPDAWRTLFGPDHSWVAPTLDKLGV